MTQLYYHGNKIKHELGTIISGRGYKKYSYKSKPTTTLEKYKPDDKTSLYNSIYMCLTYAEFEEFKNDRKFHYKVLPLGSVSKHDSNWKLHIDNLLKQKPVNQEHIKQAANNYWQGNRNPDYEPAWEYLTAKAVIKKLIWEYDGV